MNNNRNSDKTELPTKLKHENTIFDPGSQLRRDPPCMVFAEQFRRRARSNRAVILGSRLLRLIDHNQVNDLVGDH